MAQLLADLLSIAGLALLALAALEWLARRLTPQKEVLPRGLFSNHLQLGYVFTPGFVGRSNCGVEYRINSLGLRDRERDYLQPGGRRVLALGNSFAMGAGEAFADTFLAKLEDELRRRDGECEVVKAGIGGYGTRASAG